MFEITDLQSKCSLYISTNYSCSDIFFTEIGVGCAGFGIFFLFLGVVLLFDKSLLALGNVSSV